MQNAYPFLMFQQGQAADAMQAYVSLFGGRILNDDRWEAGSPGKAGTVRQGTVEVKGLTILCTDSTITHDFGMTPATSLFVMCDDEAEIDRLFAALSAGGEVRMALADYGFSRKFGWTDDRFGVSWQLNLP